MGDGQFALSQSLLSGESVEGAVALDLDLDGLPDIATVGGSGEISIQLATRLGGFASPDRYQAGTRLRPYGYPKVFVPNIAHQHILVLRNA